MKYAGKGYESYLNDTGDTVIKADKEPDKEPVIEYAGFFTRFVAAFADGIIVFFIFYVISYGINLTGFDFLLLYLPVPLLNIYVSLLSFLIAVAYWAWFESSPRQATPGKQAVSIMVVDENGKRLSFPKALTRAFFRMITMYLCTILIGLLAIVAMDFNKRNQTLYDLIAKTCVIQGKPANLIEKPAIQAEMPEN